MKVELIGDKGKTNNFEIVWNGQLMHSKSVRDEGFPKPNKLEAIVADVLKVVPASASGLRDPEETAVVQVHLTPAQVQQLGANPEQAKALLRSLLAAFPATPPLRETPFWDAWDAEIALVRLTIPCVELKVLKHGGTLSKTHSVRAMMKRVQTGR